MKAFKVIFYTVSACPRPSSGNCISRLHDNRFNRFIRIFLVVRLHRLNNAIISPKFLQDPSPDLDMRSLYLMVNRLAKVVKKRACTCDCHVCPKLLSKHSGNVCHLDRVLENVLSIARSEIESSQDRNDTWVEIEYSAFISGLLTLLFDDLIDGFLDRESTRLNSSY